MWNWINTNVEVLNLGANVAMVLIWLVYLQVFLAGFLRQTRPKIVINRAAGSSLDASCFVSNMSSDAIYIESVIVKLSVGDDSMTGTVTDFEFPGDTAEAVDPKRNTHQGTLAPAQYVSLGRFGYLIETVASRTGHSADKLRSAGHPIAVEITIIADHAAENLLIGARRQFDAEWQDNHWKLSPSTPETPQIRSRAERKKIYKMLRQTE